MPTCPLARPGFFAIAVALALATSACDPPSILPPRVEPTAPDEPTTREHPAARRDAFQRFTR